MDEYLFNKIISQCRAVSEATSYIEIFNYSDSTYNSCKEGLLDLNKFDNFLNRRGAFAAPEDVNSKTKLLSGLRLVVQSNARQPDTFGLQVVSLPPECYKDVIRVFNLPPRGIEAISTVGPFFWSSEDYSDDEPHIHIIHRKADVRKKGKTRGWEMILSYSFKTKITSGYLKGTPGSNVVNALSHLKSCANQIGHPMLLSLICYSEDVSFYNDQKQRDARDWLRRLENALSLPNDRGAGHHGRVDLDGLSRDLPHVETAELLEGVNIDGLSRDLVECHSHVLWKQPQVYQRIGDEIERAMASFPSRWTACEEEELTAAERAEVKMLKKLHKNMVSRMHFYRMKLQGLEGYTNATLDRLKIQREQLSNMMSQRDAKFNLEIAGEQRRIAHTSRKDSTAMKVLTFFGALFLPGTFLATVFGMSFFNFEADASPVSLDLWIYFAITIPITALVVFFWMWYERGHSRGDLDLEEDIAGLEKKFMFL